MTTRRRFLASGAAALALPVLDAFALDGASAAPGRLVVVFLRGGLDGLFALSPVADPHLAERRPSLAQSVLADGIRLGDTGFAAHPSCKALADLFAARELSFAPCAGTTDASRSHFQAQDLFELGSGASHGGSGFMARAAQAIGAGRGAISFTREVPLAFHGSDIALEVAPLTGSGLKLPEGRVLEAIRAAHRDSPTGKALEQAIATEAEIEASMAAPGMEAQAARGAPAATGFARVAAGMGRMLRGNPRLALAFVDLGGLDTHANQEAALARALNEIGQGLLAFKESLGEAEWRRTRVVMMSEFGRTVRENGTRGTDHGRGGLFLLAGGSGRGGRMIGGFDGLADRALNDNRDLPVLADWRALIGACMRDSYGLSEGALDRIFPGRPRQRVEV